MRNKSGKNKAKMLRNQIILNLVVIALIIIILNSSIAIYPIEGMRTRNTSIKFAWLGLASYAVVDDNPDFTSPIVVEKNEMVELEPGEYYWCIPFFYTCLQRKSFTIESEVSLTGKKIETLGENVTYLVENTGNTPSKVEVRNLLGRLITGLFILEPKAIKLVKINETAKIIAKQK